MMNYYRSLNKSEKILYMLCLGIIILGMTLRVIVWFQNRDLIIDEANIARNLYEKDFGQLAAHLSYEQYAPILFMWIEKLSSIMFGFSEKALKAYPLVCGIAALFVYMRLLKELISFRSLWYPLLCLATTYMFIRYSTEIKQYMPDLLIVLSLLLLALKTDIVSQRGMKFFFIWLVAGSIAVWASMPSVFVLAGIGVYYSFICFKSKDLKKLVPFITAAILFTSQFAWYYFTLLVDDAHSDYLQNFHTDYFLFLTPNAYHEWTHDWYRISELIKMPTGYSTFSKLFNFFLLVYGSIIMLRKETAKGLLIIVPLALTLLAAGLNEFSIIPRVALFTMPVFLILIGYGLDRFMNSRKMWVTAAVAGMAIVSAYMNNSISMIWKPLQVEQITTGMQLIKDNGIKSPDIYVYHGAKPAFLYYTLIHPEAAKWGQMKDAHLLEWDANYGAIAQQENEKFGVLFTAVSPQDVKQRKADMQQFAKLAAALEGEEYKCYAYIMDPMK